MTDHECLAKLDAEIDSLLTEAETVIKGGSLKDPAIFLLFMNICISQQKMHKMIHHIGAGMNAALSEIETEMASLKMDRHSEGTVTVQ